MSCIKNIYGPLEVCVTAVTAFWSYPGLKTHNRRHVQRCVTNTGDKCSSVSRTQATSAALCHEHRRQVQRCVTNTGDKCSGVSRTQATSAAVCHEHRSLLCLL